LALVIIFMAVSMVQVGPMFVIVPFRMMIMPVCMLILAVYTIMPMIVMASIVRMLMLMGHECVAVHMGMVFAK
jgi:hypothetical protein